MQGRILRQHGAWIYGYLASDLCSTRRETGSGRSGEGGHLRPLAKRSPRTPVDPRTAVDQGKRQGNIAI